MSGRRAVLPRSGRRRHFYSGFFFGEDATITARHFCEIDSQSVLSFGFPTGKKKKTFSTAREFSPYSTFHVSENADGKNRSESHSNTRILIVL